MLSLSVSEVEMEMVLDPGDHREEAGLLALTFTSQVRLEVSVDLGLARPGEMVRPHVDLHRAVWGQPRADIN